MPAAKRRSMFWHEVCTLMVGILSCGGRATTDWPDRLDGPVPNTGTGGGEDIMKLLDSVTRVFVLTQGSALRWLREELAALKIAIPMTDGCLGELVRTADEAACAAGSTGRRYVEELHSQLALCARFIQRWTGSDEAIAEQDEKSVHALVRIARSYALPRRWKLSEPVVVEYRRTRPSYWHWASEVDTHALPQS